MQNVDIIIKNGIVLTMNHERDIIKNGFVAVKGDVFFALGPMADAVEYEALQSVDANGGIIMPGLINTHTHIAMSGFRGLADDLELMEWLTKHIFPAEATMRREHVFQNSLLSCVEMIMGGTTCVNDMYFYADEVARALKTAGMRGVVGETLYDFNSPNYGPLENGFTFTRDLIVEHDDDELISVAVNPHSPYLLERHGLIRAYQLAEDYDVLFSIHVAETQSEVEQIRDKTCYTPVGYLGSLGALSSRSTLAHCVVLTNDDICILAQTGAAVNLCPESNLKLASGVARVPDMYRAGVTMSLGTDGCASNNDQDMFGEIGLMAKLHKGVTLNPTVMDAYTVLEMATIGGAKALRLDDQTGSLEVGKKADIIIIDTYKPHLTPIYNPVSHLVYAVKAGDVCFTMVNGRILMQNYELVDLDKQEIMAKVWENAKNYVQFM